MTADAADSDDSSPDAASLFAAHLRLLAAGESSDFEALIRAHPAHAVELRRLRDEFEHLRPILRFAGLDWEAPQRVADELRSRYGEAADPAISLEGSAPKDDAAHDSDPSSELLRRLRAHAPKSSRYRILGEVGRGGMGAVLRIWDEDLRRTSAMKVVLGKDEARGDTPQVDARTLGRFLEEAQVTGQLDHPGIVPVHELGLASDGRVYFTMRLVKGEDLRKIYEHVETGHEGWNETRALGVLLKVCEAMSYAHDKGVVHRDLKPANVMVGKYGEVYVMDWGLARVLGQKDRHDVRLRAEAPRSVSIRTDRRESREETPDSPIVTMDGDVVGTPAYMPPEQARGELDRLGPQSDVYALGAMLYHLLARHSPYVPRGTRPNNYAVWQRVQEGPPRPLSEEARDAPAELVAICDKAMARELDQRYRDMRELSEDLRAYLERRVVRAYETGTWAETKKWVQRNKPLAAAIAGIVLIASLGAAAFAVKAQEATRLKDEALARERELRVRGLFQDIAQFKASDDDFRYSRKQERPASEWWIEWAQRLVDGRSEDLSHGMAWSPGLAYVEEQIVKLRERALPGTVEDRASDRRATWNEDEQEELESKLTWYRRMLNEEIWPTADEVNVHMDEKQDTAEHRDQIARFLLDEDGAGVYGGEQYGDEVEALVLAQLAVAAANDKQRPPFRSTLAWALFRTGQFDKARAEQQLALAELGESPRKESEVYPEELAQAIADWTAEGAQAERREELAKLSAQLADRDAESRARKTWHFGEGQDEWWHRQLIALRSQLMTVQANLALVERGLHDSVAKARWNEASEMIATSPKYGGLHLPPQIGFVPIGPDPVTGLWEFAHLPSGEPARRGANSKLVMKPDTGLVFVLLPGGRVPVEEPVPAMDADQHKRLTEIDLDAFFLSKFEMTNAQWDRIGGWRRAGRETRDPLASVEGVNWDDCQAALLDACAFLSLPTAAQWEYGCRAGTKTPWWPGTDEASLRAAECIGPREQARRLTKIGTASANPFGLHDVHGNHMEWCWDDYDGSFEDLRAGDGLHVVPEEEMRVLRGGSRWADAADARSSQLVGRPREVRHGDATARPSRCITP